SDLTGRRIDRDFDAAVVEREPVHREELIELLLFARLQAVRNALQQRAAVVEDADLAARRRAGAFGQSEVRTELRRLRDLLQAEERLVRRQLRRDRRRGVADELRERNRGDELAER